MSFKTQVAYDKATDTSKVGVTNPNGLQVIEESLVDDTNIAATTHYYPSSTGMTMLGFKDLSISGKLIAAGGETNTMTVEVTNDEDTGGDWIPVYGYDDQNNVTVNSWLADAATLEFAISFNECNYKRVRVAVIVSDAVANTVIVKARRKA